MYDTTSAHCVPCQTGRAPLSQAEAMARMAQLPGWELLPSGLAIVKYFACKDFYHTMAFVNAVAWVAHQEDHHPDLELNYHGCTVRYSTHAAGGLTDNDFICAAKVNDLLH